MNGRAAFGAEMEGHRLPLSAVTGPVPSTRPRSSTMSAGQRACDRESAAGALLAVEAMADRHPHRIAVTIVRVSWPQRHEAVCVVISPLSSAPAGPARRASASGAELVLRGVDRGAGFGRLEAEVGERGEGVRGRAAARRGRGRRPSATLPSLPCSSLAMRAASLGPTPLARPIIALSSWRRRGRARRATAPTGSPARAGRRRPGPRSARGTQSRSPAEPKPNRVQASSRTCSSVSSSTSPPIGPSASSVRRAAMDEIADAADVDHRAVGAGFGEDSGEAGDHQPPGLGDAARASPDDGRG